MPVFVGPVRKPHCWFSHEAARILFSACVLVDMELVEVCSLWDIRLAVLVKPEYKPYISRVQRASVRTGIANALGRYFLYPAT